MSKIDEYKLLIKSIYASDAVVDTIFVQGSNETVVDYLVGMAMSEGATLADMEKFINEEISS